MSYSRNANRKREIESIDLTGSDDIPWESLPRKTARPNPTNGTNQSQSDSWLAPASTQQSTQQSTQSQREAWDDEDDADAVIVLSQDNDNNAAESFELYGTYVTDEHSYQSGLRADWEFLSRHCQYQDCWGAILQSPCHCWGVCHNPAGTLQFCE